ncbi:MAG: leucine-rich repeat domain-containing protein [bacterium]|nr:leucine-rich repeat domain-containing protein [bacterium]
MKYDQAEQRLSIDLSEDAFEPGAMAQYPDAREIRFDNVSTAFTLPDELGELRQLEALALYGASRKDSFPPPAGLEGLSRIKTLTLWSFCDLAALPSDLSHVESFHTVVRDPFADTRIIAERFPNLRELEIWGSHLKTGELPPEIGDFAHLEKLALVSCGLSDLPVEFARLKQLRELRLRGLPCEQFPGAICELTALELLEFKQPITKKLPESFARLTSLRKLDFAHAFNKGTMSPVDRWSEEKVYLHPLPAVIGQLPALEDLDLSMCGLVDLDFLQNARQIKRFRAQYNGLPDSKAFARFASLEYLNLENSEALKEIEGLAGLPLVELILEDCGEISDLAPIAQLPRLAKLNIDGCDELEDLDPAYQHPTLETLEASEDVLAQWKLRERLRDLRPITEVVAVFEKIAAAGKGVESSVDAERLADFEAAVADLKLHVDKNYHDENNPLAGYFAQEPDNYEIVHLPALESAFEVFRDDASIECLTTLVILSLRSVTEDNYEITLSAVGEINRREDSAAQKAVVECFKAACEYYDFGHRFMESTVLDQLYDDCFPEFTSGALIELLRDGHGDMLNSNGGDQADQLFAPAFKKIQCEKEFAALLEIFFEYQDENLEYHGAEYFGDLQEGVRAVLSGEYLTRFQVAVRERAEQMAVLELIESNEAADKIRLIAMLPELDEEFLKDNAYKVLRPLVDHFESFDLSEDHILAALRYFIERESGPYDVPRLIQKAILPAGPQAVIDFLRPFLNANQDANDPGGSDHSDSAARNARSEYIAEILLWLLQSFAVQGDPESAGPPLEIFLSEVSAQSADAVRGSQLKAIFEVLKDHRRNSAANTPEKLDALLARMDEFAAGVEQPPITIRGLDFKFDLYLMASHAEDEEWRLIKRICAACFPILAAKVVHDSVYLAIIAAGKTQDLAYFEAMQNYLPEKITETLLAYNLACVCATFEKKAAMLEYIALSIRLGKTAAQFEDDPDFAAYREDDDFRAALAAAGR